MDERLNWLLSGEPWVEYRTRLDLLNQSESDCEVIKARGNMLLHSQIRSLVSEFSHWDEKVVSNHKSAGLLIHKLVFLADIGMSVDDPGIQEIINIVMKHITESGIIQVLINVPVHFGGTGKNDWGWALCDTPSIFYSLAKLGMKNDPALINGVEVLKAFIKENGYPCAVSPELGKFRGPGKKDDPCPYATLIMLKTLTQFDKFKNGRECHIAAESLLYLWTVSKERHPYMFFMGTDFRKLKTPFVWYDILHVTDVLSQLDWLKEDARLLEMVDCIKGNAEENGLFKPQSEWKAWNGWEFGQKKEPSRWVTFLALRILMRMNSVELGKMM